MASEDEDLELLLSMQEDENVVVSGTPPSSPSAGLTGRTAQKGGFYEKDTESISAGDTESLSFSMRMAELRSSSAVKAKESSSRHTIAHTHSRSLAPEASGLTNTLGYCSDEEIPRTKQAVSMAAFKEFVTGTLDTEKNKQLYAKPKEASQQGLSISSIDVEYFSGLKIKDRLLPPAEVYQKLEDLRFVRLPAIKMANECGKIGGSWATVGILVEKGQPRQSTAGKTYVIWKLGTLDSTPVSLFLFGDSYKVHWKEQPGSILAFLNASVRADPKTKEPVLSVFHCDQIVTLGTSVNFVICNGIRKDGTRCTVAIDKRVHGQYCQYHIGALQHKYKTTRPELNGGKISIVGPGYERGQIKRKPLDSPDEENTLSRPLKIITTSQLKSMLSEEILTTKRYSQGKRFLETMAGRAVGMKKPTGIGELKSKTSKSINSDKRVPFAETLKNVDSSKIKVTTSARGEKHKDSSVTSLKTEHVTLAPRGKSKTFVVEHVTRNGTSRFGSKDSDDKDIEVEWSEGPEDEMVHALSRFGRVRGMGQYRSSLRGKS